jgi:hypothetical protein
LLLFVGFAHLPALRKGLGHGSVRQPEPREAPVFDEFLLSVNDEQSQVVSASDLPQLGLKEREHLQEWVLAHPELLGSGVAVVTSEFDKWQSASGEAIADRLDVLGLGPDGRLVVVELKRDLAPHTVHMQAVNYAAMVSRLSTRDVAELWAAWRSTKDQPLDVESVEAELQTKWLLTPDTIKSPRIVLIAAGFPASVTASVVWLNEQGVSMDLIRFRPYQLEDGRVLVNFTRIFPVPSVEDFTIGRRTSPSSAAEGKGPGAAWDLEALRRLAEQGNDATLAMLDLCAADEADGVSVQDVAAQASITWGQVRGQLAGLTMRLKNPKYGFAQNDWPVKIEWLNGGVASYRLPPELVPLWRQVRGLEPPSAPSQNPSDPPAVETEY